MNSLAAVFGVTTAVLLVMLALLQQPVEQQQIVVPAVPAPSVTPAVLEQLTAELKQLKTIIAKQQADATTQIAKLGQLKAAHLTAVATSAAPPAGAAQPAPASTEAAERAALATCTEADVPILRLLRKPCPGGYTGYDCKVRWDLQDSFLPSGRQWLAEWSESRRAATNCQRGFFDALQVLPGNIRFDRSTRTPPHAATCCHIIRIRACRTLARSRSGDSQ